MLAKSKINWTSLIFGLVQAAPMIAESIFTAKSDADQGENAAAAQAAYTGLAATVQAIAPPELQPTVTVFSQLGSLVTQGVITALHSGTPAEQVPGTAAALTAGNTGSVQLPLLVQPIAAQSASTSTLEPVAVHTAVETESGASTQSGASTYPVETTESVAGGAAPLSGAASTLGEASTLVPGAASIASK